jgi:hypothetical protein
MNIVCWADEYDSDMEIEFTKNTNSNSICLENKNNNKSYENNKYEYLNNNNNNNNKYTKFTNKICDRKCSINYKLFTIVDNSEYSCLMPWYVQQVNKSFYDIYIKNNISVNKIIDTGANIGVDSINFLCNFPNSQLICFEIENNTYKALCNNLIQFQYYTKINNNNDITNTNSKVQAYNSDFLLNMDYVCNSDIVFIDAPWGGKIYKDKKNISIYLQPENDYYNIKSYDVSKNIINITKKILQYKYNVKSVILKVPYNYEFVNLENELYKFNNKINIVYKSIYKGNTNYVAFVLIFIQIK